METGSCHIAKKIGRIYERFLQTPALCSFPAPCVYRSKSVDTWENTSGKGKKKCIGFFVYRVCNVQMGVMQIYKCVWVFTWHGWTRGKAGGGVLPVASVHSNTHVCRRHGCAQTRVCRKRECTDTDPRVPPRRDGVRWYWGWPPRTTCRSRVILGRPLPTPGAGAFFSRACICVCIILIFDGMIKTF